MNRTRESSETVSGLAEILGAIVDDSPKVRSQNTVVYDFSDQVVVGG
jgi:hypothetical protein